MVLACSIVGCTTLYGPKSVRDLLEFSAFSYVTTVLIVSDATLGDALRGCWNVLYASIQVMLPSVLILRGIGPARLTAELAALAVAVTAFMVALPNSTSLMAKRIAFGQAVIVYVGAVIHGAQTGTVMHPVHVVSSTALGAMASVVAMLLPYPHLAFLEARRACRIYAENASRRLNFLVEAFSAKDNRAAFDFLTEAKALAKTGAKHVQSIRDKQEGMMWERPRLRFRKPNCVDPGEKLQDMEILIRGMELALTSCTSFPVDMIDEMLRDFLQNAKVQIGLKLEQAKCSAPFDATTAPETKEEHTKKPLFSHRTISTTQELPACFFLNCMELLQYSSAIAGSIKCPVEKEDKAKTKESSDMDKGKSCFKFIQGSLLTILTQLRSERLVFAFKCSISLGLAVLLGLIYTKKNGYWSGLTVAISFAAGRQATFTVANARAQGTAMGSIYGIICSFIFHKFVDLRFLPLLPWIIFSSFLRHSRMYGQVGGISAVIGALLILGRTNYGTPTEFGIDRITEATIGILCLIMVELLLQRVRAATLAKTELSRCLGLLQNCIEGIVLCTEAELEPNFWFKPFHSSCYHKLLGSLSKMADILLLLAYQIEFLSQESPRIGDARKELEQQINNDIEFFVKKVVTWLKCLDGVLEIKSQASLEKGMQSRTISLDIESGKPANAQACTNMGLGDEDVEKIAGSFLQHSTEVTNIILCNEGKEMLKSQMVLFLSGLGFCISTMMRETIEMEREIKELVKWENPGRHINFHEIMGKPTNIHPR
ncbi:hypothetical protein SLEP1_g38886 [Rubroshorea leprosula]|uniref:Integral membrane bound transporter domain-containing protein n=1 Tax=Rubroshorea leprosula TaxID=152421 RepID=A0AAV5KYS9_9ROSI|nr:hypothetical protein SLEP1_g38886 [Rubroshorea leprosula]